MKETSKTGGVIRAAAIVTLLSVAERFFGFLYRVVLSRKLGAEGMGLYYIALTVFAIFVTIAASGVPVTVSRLMIKYRAEGREKQARGVVTAGVLTALCYSVPAALLLFFCRRKLGVFFTDERCVTLLLFMLPGLVVTSVYAVLRGAFWGDNRFTSYSVIELIEEIVMVLVGSIAVCFAKTVFEGTKYAALAVTLSYFTSFILAILLFFLQGGRFSSPKGTVRPLLSSALPVTGMRAANSLLNSAVAVLLPMQLLKAGFSGEAAVSGYAAANAMAVPILFAPSSIIGSISLVLVPRLSGEFYTGEGEKLSHTVSYALSTVILLAALMIPTLSVTGRRICTLLYGNLQAGALVETYAVMLFPMSLSMMTTGILNSMGEEKKTLGVFLGGSGFLLFSVLFLPRFIGVSALLVGLLGSFIVTAVGNLLLLQKKCRVSPKVGKFALQNLVVVLVSTLFGRFLSNLTGNSASLSTFLTAVGTLGFQATLLLGCGVVRVCSFRRLGRKRVR